MSTRAQMLGAIRRALRRGEPDDAARAAVQQRLRAHPANIVPARAAVAPDERLRLFEHWATANHASVACVAAPDVPAAIADYLASNNLPARAVLAPDPALDRYDWSNRPMLALRRGLPGEDDRVGISAALAGIAETGSLVFASGAEHPVTLDLLPETHVALVREADIVGPLEDVFVRLRARYGEGILPRTVITVTGPSRTGDIEQQLELGAHGPRRLHILVVRD